MSVTPKTGLTAVKSGIADLPEMAKPGGSLLVKQLNQQKVQHPDLFSHFQAGFED